MGRFDRGRIFIMIYRGDYWQCGFVIPKGGLESIRSRGLDSFHDEILEIAPFLRDRVRELKDWNDIKLLTVAVDRLPVWYRPGLLCIGDAAHAMSPVGGVGINLAIQDAVAAANILVDPFRGNRLTNDYLRKVQVRRMFPTKVMQRLQVIVQNQIIGRVIGRPEKLKLSWPLKLLRRFSYLRRFPAHHRVGIPCRACRHDRDPRPSTGRPDIAGHTGCSMPALHR